MSNHVAPGLMRLNPNGVIFPCNYDFDTEQIGYVQVSIPIAYSQAYSETACQWSNHDLWKAVVASGDIVAAMLINNTFLVSVSPTAVIIERADSDKKPWISSSDMKLLFKPKHPIGFVRTCPEVKDVNVPPYILYMDDQNRISLEPGKFITVDDAIVGLDGPLYKVLLASNRTAIYQTAKGPILL